MNNIMLNSSALLSSLTITLNKQIYNKYPDTDCKDIVVWNTNLSLTINFGFESN